MATKLINVFMAIGAALMVALIWAGNLLVKVITMLVTLLVKLLVLTGRLIIAGVSLFILMTVASLFKVKVN